MAAPVVQLADLARGGLARSPAACRSPRRALGRAAPRAGCRSSSARNSSDTASARNSPSESQRRWFSLTSCCTCLGAEPPAPGLEQPAAVHQRDDREHLRAGAQLQDREQVGQVVAQHVAGDRDRVLARVGPGPACTGWPRRPAGSRWSARRCPARPAGRAPSRAPAASCPRVSSSQNTAGAPVARARATASSHPVADRRVLGLAGPPDVALGDLVRQQHGRRRRRPPARCRPRAISKVLSWLPYSSAFCAIRPTFGRRAHRRRVEGAVLAAERRPSRRRAGRRTSPG